MWINVDGPDGAGKTTLITGLVEHLVASGKTVNVYREPGGTETGEKIRDIVKGVGNTMCKETETFLFLASRIELYDNAIRDALDRGEVVITDRGNYSTIVYQGLAIGNQSWVSDAIRLAMVGLPQPDKTLLLLPSFEDILSRQEERGTVDRMESKGMKFKKDVYDAYVELSSRGYETDVTVDNTGLSSTETLKLAIGSLSL